MSDSSAEASSRAVEERRRDDEGRSKSSSSRRESSSRHGSSRRDSERRHDEHRDRKSHSHRDGRHREIRKGGSRQDHDQERRRREYPEDKHRSGSSSKRHRNDDEHESKRSRRHRHDDERYRSSREDPRRTEKDNREHGRSSHRHRDSRESSARDRKDPPPLRSRSRSRSPPPPASTSRQQRPTSPSLSAANHTDEDLDDDAPNFAPSGLLAAESNTVNGVALKYHEPPEARKPKHPWRLYCFKDAKQNEVLHLAAQSAYLLGRDRTVVDIPLDHESCSKQHAVLQFRQTITTNEFGDKTKRIQPFLIDLESSNGSYVNDNEIPTSRYYQLRSGDTLTFGASTREYVLLDESAA